MRPCVKCGTAIGNGDATCTECGAQQLPSVGVNPKTPVRNSDPDDVSWKEIVGFELCTLAALLGVLGIAIVTFLVFGTIAGVVTGILLGLLYLVGVAEMSS